MLEARFITFPLPLYFIAFPQISIFVSNHLRIANLKYVLTNIIRQPSQR